MIPKLLNRLFIFLASREILIALCFGIFIFMLPMIIEQFSFWLHYNIHHSTAQIEDMENLIDTLGGVLVAAGVFMESRETLRSKALRKTESNALQLDLNEVAHHNGMGLLLMGLFMEIGTALIGLPKHIFNVSKTERSIFCLCLILSILSILILFDFIKDYIRTYFKSYKD